MAELQPYETQQKEPKKPKIEDENPEHAEILKRVDTLLKRGNRATKGRRSKWSENYRFVVGGDQWSTRRPRWRFSEVVNIAWANIMAEVGIQTDSRPKFDFTPTEIGDFQFAKVLNDINDVLWSKPLNLGYGWMNKTAVNIFKSKIYDVVHAEICWNPDLEGGLGDVEYNLLDPYGCFWDPKATHIGDARWFIYIEATPTNELKSKHPEFKDRIKADLYKVGSSPNKLDDHDIDLFFSNVGLFTDTGNGRTDRDQDAFGGEEMTMKIRCWLKDDETFEEIIENDKGEQEKVIKKKYPKGRYIEICNKNVLKDEENPYDDGLFPIARLVNYEYGEYMGENEVTHQRGPQKIVNYSWSHVMDEFKKGNNPQRVFGSSNEDAARKVTDEPGLAIVLNDISQYRQEPGVGVSPSSFNVVEKAESLLDKVQGTNESSRGAVEPGVQSGYMFEGVVEASQTRIRLKNRNIDEYLNQIGYLVASRILQYYTAVRSFRITGDDGFPQFVEFYITKDEHGNNKAIIKRTPTDGKGNPTEATSPIELTPKGLPDVKVVSGSNLPYSKARIQALAKDLFANNAITLESYLETVEWPNAKEEARKVQELQAQMAQGAQQ